MLSSWFLKGEIDSVITCQPTPGGILARKIKESINSDPRKKRILVTEGRWLLVTVSIKKTDPLRQRRCRYMEDSCIVEEGRDCSKQS